MTLAEIKDTPQLELLLRTVLYQKTSASGHSQRCQNHESTITVRPAMFCTITHDYLIFHNLTYSDTTATDQPKIRS